MHMYCATSANTMQLANAKSGLKRHRILGLGNRSVRSRGPVWPSSARRDRDPGSHPTALSRHKPTPEAPIKFELRAMSARLRPRLRMAPAPDFASAVRDPPDRPVLMLGKRTP